MALAGTQRSSVFVSAIGTHRIEDRSARSEGAVLATILKDVANGDRAAFEEIYRRTSAHLFGICLCILPDRDEAEEALQEVYLSLWRNAGTYDEQRGAVMTWLTTMARNKAIDHRRRTANTMIASFESVETIPDPHPSQFETAAEHDDARRLYKCLGVINGDDADLVRAAYMQGGTYGDLARRFSMPLGTVKSRVRRALIKLRFHFDPC